MGVWWIARPARAHGVGGRQDLPVPLGFFVTGAAVVLVVSFAALALLWPRPRLQDPPDGKPLRLNWLRPVLGVVGVLGLALAVVAGLVGPTASTANPTPVLVFVVFWLVVPFIAAVAGDVYPSLSPWRTLLAWLGLGGRERPGLVDRWGYVPAAMAFVAFTWIELVSPEAGPRTLAVAAFVYTAYLLGMGTIVGRETMTTSVDGFAVYNRLLGGLGPIGEGGGGRMAWRGWLRSLVATPERRGLVAFVMAMIGTVTYDGASASRWWGDAIADPVNHWLVDLGLGGRVAEALSGTVFLLTVVALVWGAYQGASWAAARLAGGEHTATTVAIRFAHTLVPIAFAYAFAHYFTLILFEGQLLLSSMSDPFGQGWDLFGTRDRRVDFSLIAGSATWVWYVQVGVIVGGHLAGVVLAHDRALNDFPPARAVASQYAMLGLMVLLTGLGLVILAAG